MMKRRYVDPRTVPQPGAEAGVLTGKTPAVGELAAEFELLDSTGASRRLSELVSRGPAVLLFYRGSW